MHRQGAQKSDRPAEGIRVITDNDSDITDIRAVIDGPADTPYAGGKFLHQNSLSERVSEMAPPKGYFLTKIFHPNVASPSGEICVNTLKKDWKSDLGIKHFIDGEVFLLNRAEPESAQRRSGKLLLERYDDYIPSEAISEFHAQGSNLPSTRALAANSSDLGRRDDTNNSQGYPRPPSRTSAPKSTTKSANRAKRSGSSSSASSSASLS